MKAILALMILSISFQSLEAREWVSKVRKYIHKDSNQIIELGGWDLSEDGKTNKFYNYKTGKQETIQMEDYIIQTFDEIANVRAGEVVIAKTLVGNSRSETIERICDVYYLFENKKAYLGCKSYEKDAIPGYSIPARFDFIVNNVENIVAEVSELDGFKKGDVAEILVDANSIKNGKTIRVLAVMANGEAIVQKMGFSVLDSSSIIYKGGVERVKLSDLRKNSVE
jgi:hypothetical protein